MNNTNTSNKNKSAHRPYETYLVGVVNGFVGVVNRLVGVVHRLVGVVNGIKCNSSCQS